MSTTASKTMKAYQSRTQGLDFEQVEIPRPSPEKGEVLIRVKACGICHSDDFVKQNAFPGLTYPRTPGHEVAGIIEELGKDVDDWQVGDRVGVGWFGGCCHRCPQCKEGDHILCDEGVITGITRDGGYAEYMTASQDAIASIPEELSFEEAAPLLCAGITTFNSLRNGQVDQGDVVAIQGIGGLGHLAIQYAAKLGFRVVAISGSASKEELAMKLGANHYLDSSKVNVVEELQKLGGAKLILATAPNADVISSVIPGLAKNGRIVIVAGSNDPVSVSPIWLISGRRSIVGWPSGAAKDSQDTLNFSADKDVKPSIETYPIDQVNEAFQRMISNQARFRVVLTV